MNLDKEQNIRQNFTERQSSSSSYITAWHIESTLNSMQEFIKLIEASQTQRLNLKSILPHILRLKKFDQEKQTIVKELKDLMKINAYFLQNKAQKQKNIAFNHQNKLKQMVKSLKEHQKTIQKRITEIRSTTIDTKVSLQNKRNEKKKSLTSQISFLQSNQADQASQKISQKQKILNVGNQESIYEAFIEEYVKKCIFPSRKSSQLLKSHSEISSLVKSNFEENEVSQELDEKKDKRVDFEQIFKQLEHIQTELGQSKCKLLSLQDKKRKLTVQDLFRYKKPSKKVDRCGFEASSNSKNIKLGKEMAKSKTILSQQSFKTTTNTNLSRNEGNFLSSILSIFSDTPQPQLKPIAQQSIPTLINDSKTKISSPSAEQLISQKEIASSLSQIEDSETKLRMIEINSEILQLREHIYIMVNQNIFDPILASVMTIKQINRDLHPLLEQLVQVIAIFGTQSIPQRSERILPSKSQQVSPNLTPFQSPKSFSSKKLSISKVYGESFKFDLKENQNMKFFMGIIASKFKLRVQITQKLFSSLKYSISVVIKYLRKRFAQIKDQYEAFIEGGIVKDQKIKATQALKSRTQVLMINSALEALNYEISQVIESRLVKFEELLQTQSLGFRRHLSEMGKQQQISVLQRMVLNQKDLQIENHLKQKNLTINLKGEINHRFFSFYENFIAKSDLFQDDKADKYDRFQRNKGVERIKKIKKSKR